jgi:hypothetical protein
MNNPLKMEISRETARGKSIEHNSEERRIQYTKERENSEICTVNESLNYHLI